ncbi:MAG: ABC transporter ATP-binding protein [Nocardioidaceae bacterium]|nr:ABC transporter ATP-binding protein [Nocardioidaceae bacterium]
MGLELRDVTVRFDDADRPAVADVDLDLPAGQVLAVLGPSGCGKSTLLRAVAGLEPLAAGRVAYDGADLDGVPTHKRGFALMFQDGQLFPHQTVAGNVGYALRLRRTPRTEVVRRVGELLDLVGLTGLEDRTPATLSGGERQRVALARSLAVQPRLLLLDEPLSALDRGLRERLAHDLRDILVRAGTTALLVTHDQEEAFAVADRMALMRAGRVVQQGSLDDVWRAPVDADAARFLGYATVLSGQAAALVQRAGGATDPAPEVALRRSAVRVAPDGPLTGRVLAARVTPEVVRLTVDVDGVGTVDAVADQAGPAAAVPGVGTAVPLVVDLTRTAPLGEGQVSVRLP